MDYHSLTCDQMLNHYGKTASFTTKVDGRAWAQSEWVGHLQLGEPEGVVTYSLLPGTPPTSYPTCPPAPLFFPLSLGTLDAMEDPFPGNMG